MNSPSLFHRGTVALYRGAVAKPWVTLLISAVVVLAAGAGLPRLVFRTDGQALVPEGDHRIGVDREIRARFGVGDPVIVVVETTDPRGIYNPETLRRVSALTEALARVSGLDSSSVVSLATEKGDHLRPDGRDFRRLLEPLPVGEEPLRRLREDVHAIGLYRGTLISEDERAATIFAEISGKEDRERVLQGIRRAVRAEAGGGDRISVLGAPVAESLLGVYLLADLGISARLTGSKVEPDPVGSGAGILARIRRAVGKEIGLLPLALAIMTLVFLIAFRAPGAALLPLFEVGACIAFVFGLMGWLGIPVTLPLVVLPVILTATGVSDAIHMFHRYQGHVSRGLLPRPAVLVTLDELWGPVTRTSLTTAIGFLSFVASPLGPLRAFGVFAALGVLFCLVWSLATIPALLVLLPPRLVVHKRPREEREARGNPMAMALARWTLRHRVPVLIGAGVLALGIGAGMCRLRVQDSWIDGFPPQSGFVRATHAFDRNFLGTHVLLVAVTTKDTIKRGVAPARDILTFGLFLPPDAVPDPAALPGMWIRLQEPAPDGAAGSGRAAILAHIVSAREKGGHLEVMTDPFDGPLRVRIQAADSVHVTYEIRSARLLDPGTLQQVCSLENFLRARVSEQVGGVLGPYELLATTAFLTAGRRESERRVPEQPSGLRQVWASYRHVRGEERFRETVTPGYDQALIRVYLKAANYADTRRLLKQLSTYEREILAPAGLSLSLAGDVAVSQTLIKAVVTTQVRSILLSLVGILALMAAMWRTWRGAIVGVLPAVVAVGGALGTMGWMGIPLGVATSMFAAMVLGTGVDYAIHLVDRYRFSTRAGMTRREALVDAVGVTTLPLLVHGLSLGLGFGVLILSQVPANARLGGVLAVTLLACLVTTVVLLPPLLEAFTRSEAVPGGPPREGST